LKAAILTIGDELTCGYRLDTNSQAISRRLATLPADVVLHLSVSDDLDDIHTGLHVARHVAEVVIVTGGLGPTEDDLTRQAIASHFGLALEEDAEVLARVRELFARRGREMPESNRIQAQIPSGSTVIYNDRGTAAGFYLAVDGKHVFVTPGIPYEMEGMLEAFILPRLRELVGEGRHVRRAALKVYGLPESGINERIQSMMGRDRNPLLGLLPHRGTITIEVVATGSAADEAESLLEADLESLRAELGKYVISEDERELPQVVADLLVERELTIAVAEVGTGGLVAARLTEAEGHERWFRGGTVLDADVTCEDGALAQALAAREAAVADVGVGVGPVIVRQDETSGRPYGETHVAVNLQEKEFSRQLSFNGDRARVREWVADAVLALVRRWVLRRTEDGGQGD
jgi:nicotinamide-nucleotide amidase